MPSSSRKRVARKARIEDRAGGLASEDLGVHPELEGDRHLRLPREDSGCVRRVGPVETIEPGLGLVEPTASLVGVAQAVVSQGQAIGVHAPTGPVALDRQRLLETADRLVELAGTEQGRSENIPPL